MTIIWKKRKLKCCATERQGTTAELLGQDPEVFHLCSFCDERRATAYWSLLGQHLRCCPRCALTDLASFIADAIVGEDGPYLHSTLRRAWEAAEAAFWKAAAIALERRNDDIHPHP